MAYEIDFVGAPNAKKDYDAIAFRYWSCRENRWIVCVFDGGTAEAGDDLCNHLRLYYLNGGTMSIDYVFCSHPHEDHASGLRSVLQNFRVKHLIMNRPWAHRHELIAKVTDGRITAASLKRRLEENFNLVCELEELAERQNCVVISGLSGVSLCPEMHILSPAKEFYIQCLCESDKTPAMASVQEASTKTAFASSDNLVKATWGIDDIREGESTSADNESSIVLRVHPDGDAPFLLVGDVGCRGLKTAMDYADSCGIPLNKCTFLQIPHHGGRHNVSPSVLDRLVGGPVPMENPPTKTAFVSVAKDSDHPRKCVVNAFINRGCKVFVAKGETLRHQHRVGARAGWVSATREPFSEHVEAW